MRNKYAGVCYRCGETVAAGAGYFEQVWRSKRATEGACWRVQHVECCRKAREVKARDAAARASKAQDAAASSSKDFPKGERISRAS